MYKTILAGVSIAALSVSTAMAADFGAVPTKAPNFVAPYWTGVYVGLNAGYAWNATSGPSAGSATALNFPSLRPNGFIGGGQVGYNWQAGSLVLGGELDFSGMNLKAEQSVDRFFFGGKFPHPGRFSTQYDWLFTARAKAGVTLAANWLLYVTGGLAVTHVADFITAGPAGTWSGSKALVGGTIGGGIEYGFAPNWSLRAEYLYAKFGDTTPPLVPSNTVPLPGSDNIAKFSHDLNIVRMGVNYKFGG